MQPVEAKEHGSSEPAQVQIELDPKTLLLIRH